MQTFTLDLWEEYNYPGAGKDNFRPTLDAYIIKGSDPRPAVLILPGSGYFQCSPREAEALALRFNAAFYHAFVLWYSCDPRRHPIPILDCERALTVIRENAAAWTVDSRRVGVMGFSAGGHLALSAAIFRNQGFAAAPGINPGYSRPDALMLCYPVISSGEYAHRGSFDCLLGTSSDPALLDLLSLENHIDVSLPPVFLWHTYTDDAVPVENSFFLASALKRAGVPLEMHIFPEGRHGLSLAIPEVSDGDPGNINAHAAQWFGLCLNWLVQRFAG
jgi:acetyl esterase/lipase